MDVEATSGGRCGASAACTPYITGVLDDRTCRCGVERAESVAAEMRAAMSPLLQR
jgi:hypothetical protein